MKRSRSGHLGFCGSCCRTSKNNVTRISTAESDPPGWPDLAWVIISTISRRICFAIVCSSVGLFVFFIACFQCSNAGERDVESSSQLSGESARGSKKDALHAEGLGSPHIGRPVVEEKRILGGDAQTS